MRVHVWGRRKSLANLFRYVNPYSEKFFDTEDASYPDKLYEYIVELEEALTAGRIDKIVIERDNSIPFYA